MSIIDRKLPVAARLLGLFPHHRSSPRTRLMARFPTLPSDFALFQFAEGFCVETLLLGLLTSVRT